MLQSHHCCQMHFCLDSHIGNSICRILRLHQSFLYFVMPSHIFAVKSLTVCFKHMDCLLKNIHKNMVLIVLCQSFSVRHIIKCRVLFPPNLYLPKSADTPIPATIHFHFLHRPGFPPDVSPVLTSQNNSHHRHRAGL